MKIPIRHGSNYQKTEEIFQEILQSVCGEYAKKSMENWADLSNKYNVEAAQVEPMVSMSFDENWMVFTLRYIVDYKKRRSTKFEISNQILARIKDKSLNIDIAASTLEVTNFTGKPQN
jgi:hypothetical protein